MDFKWQQEDITLLLKIHGVKNGEKMDSLKHIKINFHKFIVLVEILQFKGVFL